MRSKILARNALTAAAYAAITVTLSPVSYGPVQFRLSELLILFAFYDSRLCPGLILGCLLANCFSPTLLYDLPFGTAATALALYSMQLIRRHISEGLSGLMLSALSAGLINGLLVGLELTLAFSTPFLLNALSVFAGESAVLFAGAFLFKYLRVPLKRIRENEKRKEV